MSPVHQVWPKPSCKAQWKGKKTRQTEEEVIRQHQGMDRPGARQVPEGSGEQGKMEKTGCKMIWGAQTILAVKGLIIMMIMMMMMMMMMMMNQSIPRVCFWQGHSIPEYTLDGAYFGPVHRSDLHRPKVLYRCFRKQQGQMLCLHNNMVLWQPAGLSKEACL